MSEPVIALACHATEAKILSACILRPEIFEYLADISVDHFASPAHRVAWSAMRRLQADGEQLGALPILDAIELHDLERETRTAETVNGAWLGLLVLDNGDYTEEILFDRDVEWLRTLHDRRAAL